jgi:hypothetical protein
MGADTVYEICDSERVAVRPGDKVLGHCELTAPPKLLLVSSSGRGFVALDTYGFNGTATATKNAVVISRTDGRIAFVKTLGDVFTDEQIDSFQRLDASLIWLGGAWIDEERAELVIIGARNKRGAECQVIRVIRLETGKVRDGGGKDVLRAIEKRNRMAMELALDAARGLGLKEVAQQLPAIVKDQDLTLGARLRAAVWLAGLGDHQGKDVIVKASLLVSNSDLDGSDTDYYRTMELERTTEYALSHLVEVLGKDALPALREITAKQGFHMLARRAYVALGKNAVPELIRLVRDASQPEGQAFAAQALGEIGPEAKAGIPALAEALSCKAKTKAGLKIRGLAAWALSKMGREAKSLLPKLRELEADADDIVRMQAAEAVRAIEQDRAKR